MSASTSAFPWWQISAKWLRRGFGPWLGVHDQYRPRPLSMRPGCQPPHNDIALPTISLVTPSFNQGVFLERTLRSVLEQGYPSLQLIVQDGGSTDQSLEILERYRPRLHHVASGRDRGQSHAINLGFRHATGDVLAYLNSDDMLLPGSLHAVAAYFNEHPKVDVVYGHRVIINENDEDVGRWIMPRHHDASLAWNDYIPQETLFWRRGIWNKIGAAIDENLHFGMDWDLLLRFRQAGARFVRLPRFLGAFRIHTQQKSDRQFKSRSEPEHDELRRKYHGRTVGKFECRLRVAPFLLRSILLYRLFQMGILRY